MLNKATNLMNKQSNERNNMADKCHAAIADAQKALKVLGFEEVTLEEIFEETKEQPTIIINKGKIVPVTDPRDQEEIDNLYREIGRHIGRINQLAAENEELREQLDFKELLLNEFRENMDEKIKTIHSLEEQLKQLKKTRIKPMEEELKEYKQQLEQEEADAVKKPNKLDLLKKVKEAEKRKEENTNKNLIEEGLKAAEREAQRKAEEKEAAKSQMPKYTFDYEQVTFDENIDSSTDFGVRGNIAFDTEEYKFEATNNHHMPIVYGCMSEEIVRLVKQIITNEVDRFNFMNELEGGAANFTHAQDEEFPLVVWRLTDDKGNVNYHAYTDKYVLIWNNNKFKVPARKMLKYALDKDPKHYRKLEQQKNTKKLSDKFIAVCKELYAADFTPDNDPEPTKAVIKITKEEVKTISYTEQPKITIEVDTEGCDDLDL